MPCFTYCINVWCNCNKTDLNRLFMYQKLFLMTIQQSLMNCLIGPNGVLDLKLLNTVTRPVF